MQNFKDKVVIVTGGSRGQGAVEATLFAERGASVALCDVLEVEGEAAAAELRARGLQARFFRLDVRSADDWSRVVAAIIEWRSRIDVLVNNAGTLSRQTISNYTDADWHRILDINLTGSFFGIRQVAPHMQAQGGGAIVNIASNSAFSGHADAAYTASKWGVRGLTKSAALEFAADRIRVNCVCPGLVLAELNRDAPHVQTMIGMTPLGRSVDPGEIASVVAFLASDEASMVTAEEIVVDGGFITGGAYWKVSVDAGYYPSQRRAKVGP